MHSSRLPLDATRAIETPKPVVKRTARSQTPAWVLSSLFAVALVACGGGGAGSGPTSGAAGTAKAPTVQVGVVTATPGDVGLVTQLPGRIEALRTAQIRARSTGILQERLFREGSDVKAGQVLFKIDAAPYEAALASARAQLARAQASEAQASAQLERFRPLAAANAVSQQDFVNAQAAQKTAQADVAAGQAAVRQAEINLGYTRVTSPIAGRIGRALVTEGALVGQAEATPLALVQQINPVYVNFTQSATEVLQLRRALQSGQLRRAQGQDAASVRVILADGSEYPLLGKLLFSDLSVDASTGQITLRAEVPNPQGDLLPGLYVRVQLEQAQAADVITLPQQAVTRTQQGDMVNVVDKDGKVTPRKIKVSLAQGNRWLVQEGLQAGEQVMVDGFQKLMMLPPGTPVQTVPWQPPSAAPVTAASAAASPAAPAASAAK